MSTYTNYRSRVVLPLYMGTIFGLIASLGTANAQTATAANEPFVAQVAGPQLAEAAGPQSPEAASTKSPGALAWMPPVMDNRIFTHVLFNQLEGRTSGSGSALRWDGEGWIGTDTNRLWLKSEGFLQGTTMSDGDPTCGIPVTVKQPSLVFAVIIALGGPAPMLTALAASGQLSMFDPSVVTSAPAAHGAGGAGGRHAGPFRSSVAGPDPQSPG